MYWMDVAGHEIGVKEVPGDGDNPRVIEYHELGADKLRAQSDSVPWCAAFVGWVLAKSGIKGTGFANARSYLSWGEGLPSPRPGCVVVMKRGNSSWQGHVGFLVSSNALYVTVLGGNQGDAVSIAKFPRWSVIGYRWHPAFNVVPVLKLR